LEIDFEEGDAEALPFPDARFDLVATMFGYVRCAPGTRGQRTDESMRARCRGRYGELDCESFVGKSFRLTARYTPPPDGIPAPTLWGNEKVVRERFGETASQIATVRRELTFDYPLPPSEVVQFFRQNFGPTQTAFSRLNPAEQLAYAADLESLWSQHNEAKENGRTLVRNEYLEVIATRA
jgi:hypothetical protein